MLMEYIIKVHEKTYVFIPPHEWWDDVEVRLSVTERDGKVHVVDSDFWGLTTDWDGALIRHWYDPDEEEKAMYVSLWLKAWRSEQ